MSLGDNKPFRTNFVTWFGEHPNITAASLKFTAAGAMVFSPNFTTSLRISANSLSSLESSTATPTWNIGTSRPEGGRVDDPEPE